MLLICSLCLLVICCVAILLVVVVFGQISLGQVTALCRVGRIDALPLTRFPHRLGRIAGSTGCVLCQAPSPTSDMISELAVLQSNVWLIPLLKEAVHLQKNVKQIIFKQILCLKCEE